MPAQQSSLAITDHYIRAVEDLVDRVLGIARTAWTKVDLDNLDRSFAPVHRSLATNVRRSQRDMVRLAVGYVVAFLSSELGRHTPTPPVEVAPYVGVSFNGKDLDESLRSPIVKVKQAIAADRPDPMAEGLRALLAGADVNTKAAGRSALRDLYAADRRIVGWRRVTHGGCAACRAAADGSTRPPGEPLAVHPRCSCSAEAVVAGVDHDAVKRPTGQQAFEAMTEAEQDTIYTPAVATLLRRGGARVSDLAMASGGFIRTRPLEQLAVAGIER